MRQEQLDQILEKITNIFKSDSHSLETVLQREIILNFLKLTSDDLDTLDLKVINRSFRELRYAFKVFKPYRHIRKVSIFGSARPPRHPG